MRNATLRQLRTFGEVARLQSYTAAAKALHLTQPAVSMQLRQLEQAAGLPLFRRLCVHGHWQMQAGKMSKSLGNVVRPLDMKARFGMDAFRYYLLREMAFGQDAEFSEEALVGRLNADLANSLGNLASRVLAMQQRYCGGVLQPLAPEPHDEALRSAFATARRDMDAHVAELALHRALEALIAQLRAAPDRATLDQFLELLRSHIRLEENEFFESAQRSVSAAQLQSIGEEIDRRAVRICL